MPTRRQHINNIAAQLEPQKAEAYKLIDDIAQLEEQILFWPDAVERKQISKRIQAQYHFPCCIGFVDGTHLGLAFRPEVHG